MHLDHLFSIPQSGALLFSFPYSTYSAHHEQGIDREQLRSTRIKTISYTRPASPLRNKERTNHAAISFGQQTQVARDPIIQKQEKCNTEVDGDKGHELYIRRASQNSPVEGPRCSPAKNAPGIMSFPRSFPHSLLPNERKKKADRGQSAPQPAPQFTA